MTCPQGFHALGRGGRAHQPSTLFWRILLLIVRSIVTFHPLAHKTLHSSLSHNEPCCCFSGGSIETLIPCRFLVGVPLLSQKTLIRQLRLTCPLTTEPLLIRKNVLKYLFCCKNYNFHFCLIPSAWFFFLGDFERAKSLKTYEGMILR